MRDRNRYMRAKLEEFRAIILITVKDLCDILCVFGTCPLQNGSYEY